jgi:hypothetical protein
MLAVRLWIGIRHGSVSFSRLGDEVKQSGQLAEHMVVTTWTSKSREERIHIKLTATSSEAVCQDVPGTIHNFDQ